MRADVSRWFLTPLHLSPLHPYTSLPYTLTPLSLTPLPYPSSSLSLSSQGAAKFKQTSKIGNSRFRQLISDFGPSFVIVCMSILAAQPFISNSVFIGDSCPVLSSPTLLSLISSHLISS